MKHIANKIQRERNITYKCVDSIVYIFDVRTNTIHTLNDVASFIWNHIEKPTTIDALTALITKEYEVSDNQVIEDIDIFIKEYVSKGYIKYKK